MTRSSDTVEQVAAAELGSESLAGPWRAFAEARSNPFATPEWTRSWLRTHPAEEPFVLAWRRGGELRGVLPLVRVRRGPLRLLRFAGARRADWVTPACREADEAEMARACGDFLGRERGWHLLRLDRLDEDSVWPAAVAATAAPGIVPAPVRRRDVLPFIAFEEGGFDAYLAGRSRNFRSQLGRRRRRLERDHDLRFRMTEDPERLDADLDAFFGLHDARWSRRGGSSSADAATREHIRGFARGALERGWLRLWIAEADGRPAAAWYGWRLGRRYCYALAGLDEAFEPLGLGNVMLGHTIQEAASEGASIYDFMWGEEEYKRRFETDRRYAATWLFSKSRHPVRWVAGSGVRAARAAEALPPGLREPLARVARSVRPS